MEGLLHCKLLRDILTEQSGEAYKRKACLNNSYSYFSFVKYIFVSITEQGVLNNGTFPTEIRMRQRTDRVSSVTPALNQYESEN